MSTANVAIRDRLKEVRDQSRSLRDQRADARKERDAAKESFANVKMEGSAKITEMPEFKNAEESVRRLGTLDDQLADLKIAEESILKMLGDDAPSSEVIDNGNGTVSVPGRGWDGAALVGPDTSYGAAKKANLFSSSAKFGTIQLGQIASREEAVRFLSDLPTAPAGPVTTTGASGLIQPDTRGLVQPSLRPLRFLDLIPTGTTDSNSIEYVQVTQIPGTAAPVAEGVLKPEQGLTLTDNTAPVRTIAGWIKVNRQAMDDAAGLASLINTLLPYDVRRKIEAQVIAGDGLGQNLKGITRQTGLGAPAYVAGDNIADAILRAMTTVILADHDPNFAALHPLDWQELLLMREVNTPGSKSGLYLYGGPGTMGAATIWGLTVTPSTAIASTSPLVGDSMGVTLLVREGVNVKTSDSDQDDFVRNRVTVLAEARVALPVWFPSAFAVADYTP